MPRYLTAVAAGLVAAAVAGAQPPIPPADAPAKVAARAAPRAAGPKFPDSPAPSPPPAPAPAPAPAPKPADGPIAVPAGKYVVFTADTELFVRQVGPGSLDIAVRKAGFVLPADKVVNWPADKDNPEVVTFADPFVYVGKAGKDGAATVVVVPKGVQDEKAILVKSLAVGKATPVDPPVVDPDEKPKPGPLTSFKVLMVYESADTLKAGYNAVLYGKAVEEYLTARCTGGKAGWGRRDKDTAPAADTTGLKDLWAAVRPQVTSTPAFAIAVNSKVTLEPLPATPAEAVALLKRYAGDK